MQAGKSTPLAYERATTKRHTFVDDAFAALQVILSVRFCTTESGACSSHRPLHKIPTPSRQGDGLRFQEPRLYKRGFTKDKTNKSLCSHRLYRCVGKSIRGAGSGLSCGSHFQITSISLFMSNRTVTERRVFCAENQGSAERSVSQRAFSWTSGRRGANSTRATMRCSLGNTLFTDNRISHRLPEVSERAYCVI